MSGARGFSGHNFVPIAPQSPICIRICFGVGRRCPRRSRKCARALRAFAAPAPMPRGPPQRSRLPGIAHALFCVGIPFQTRNAKTVASFF
jgi:hypothetical protein